MKTTSRPVLYELVDKFKDSAVCYALLHTGLDLLNSLNFFWDALRGIIHTIAVSIPTLALLVGSESIMLYFWPDTTWQSQTPVREIFLAAFTIYIGIMLTISFTGHIAHFKKVKLAHFKEVKLRKAWEESHPGNVK